MFGCFWPGSYGMGWMGMFMNLIFLGLIGLGIYFVIGMLRKRH